jgi:phosphate transport system permease protein
MVGSVINVRTMPPTNGAERAFVERTSAAIIVLLAFMLVMNLTAIMLRKRFERRW